MDAPPPEDVPAFLRIARHLQALGLHVPAILDADEAAGMVLEEDLGDDLLSVLLDRGDAPGRYLDAATDALVTMHRAPMPDRLVDWSTGPMRTTAMGTLFDWWWPARYNAPAPQEARDDIHAALDVMLRPVAAGPVCFVHRDYFAGNLLWLPEGRLGILDFQLASAGHPAYDLVSLLQDARRHIPAASEQRGVERYLAARRELDADAFRAAYAACAAQRHLRVACQWVRLALREGRRQYLAYGPRTWRLLDQALAEPAAAPLAAALNRWIPHADRGNPPGLNA
jgi:aminoglycoside/choline kinase family phosphotransferase